MNIEVWEPLGVQDIENILGSSAREWFLNVLLSKGVEEACFCVYGDRAYHGLKLIVFLMVELLMLKWLLIGLRTLVWNFCES